MDKWLCSWWNSKWCTKQTVDLEQTTTCTVLENLGREK